MQWKAFIRGGFVLLFSAVLAFGSCSLFETADEDQTGLFVLLAAALTSSSGCQNNSGLVICIPPGLRF